jgi:hypothetical protein
MGDGLSNASVRVLGTGSSAYSETFACAVSAGCSGGGTFSGQVSLRPADSGSVILNVESIAPAQPSQTSSAYSFIDPYFFIDPDFLAANPGYSVSTLTVGNAPVTPVPEPETWALMLGGLAVLGRASHWRRSAIRGR